VFVQRLIQRVKFYGVIAIWKLEHRFKHSTKLRLQSLVSFTVIPSWVACIMTTAMRPKQLKSGRMA